ncbi:hypothetical protein [Capillimicrobium parvum]|nr:hypothetical protein [Capillimicrobium parvum]
MPTWLLILIIVVGALIVLFLVGGAIAVSRRNAASGGRLLRELAGANEALARARAEDRGWDRDTIDAAARTAHLARRPSAQITALHLVQVVDRPGTEHDEARVRITDDAGVHDVLLGRAGDAWVERTG